MANEQRLIDANAYAEAWKQIPDEYESYTARQVIEDIMSFPTVDAMEVVRCKDCKHCSNNTPDGLHWCDEHERGSLCDDDFCSYGERREGE